MTFEEMYFSGEVVYGDDFSEEQIAKWFEEEAEAYFELTSASEGSYSYDYHALNDVHAFSALAGRRFETCLAFGASNGDEVLPIAPSVDRFVCIEPAEGWWRDKIGLTPSTYMRPAVSGTIALEDSRVDLVTCLGTLHHVPNPSHILAEFTRVLKPGGLLIVREPCVSMGDWRRPRRGATKNERGLPLPWLLSRLDQFEVERVRHCMFPATSHLGKAPYNSKAMVWADWLLSSATAWNLRYHRPRLWDKLAPASAFVIARRR